MFAATAAAARRSTAVLAAAPRRAASSAAPAAFSPLTALETRWGKLPEAEQGAIADLVAVAEKGDWKNMTLEQKRAAYFIAYGPYGARNPIDPALKWSVITWSAGFFVLSYGLYQWWETMKPPVISQTKEWQADVEKKAKEEGINPYSGPRQAIHPNAK
ncbi:Cytochrome c oxidase subunit 5A [Cladochytrium tenue]|nr:Cytochrome c oxidase subunit 5A [Cladochytrium tenue]